MVNNDAFKIKANRTYGLLFNKNSVLSYFVNKRFGVTNYEILQVFLDILDHFIMKIISNITKNTCISLKPLNLQNHNQSDIFELIESACNLLDLNLRLVKLNMNMIVTAFLRSQSCVIS